jgi:hypothetical protein
MAKKTSTHDGNVEQRVVAFAEQVGRVVGTVQAKTEGWLDRQKLTEQITHVRDSASDLLKHLSRGNGEALEPALKRAKAADPKGRSGGIVDAPGKRHRKPSPSVRGAKKSDTRLAKMKTLNADRRQRPGQG